MKAQRYAATLQSLADGQIAEHTPVNESGVLLVAPAPGTAGGSPTTGTASSVADAASSTTILAANANRKGATVFNDSTSSLYLLLGAGTASTTNLTVLMAPGDYYELPVVQGGVYTGIISGIWSANSTGAARVTEFT